MKLLQLFLVIYTSLLLHLRREDKEISKIVAAAPVSFAATRYYTSFKHAIIPL